MRVKTWQKMLYASCLLLCVLLFHGGKAKAAPQSLPILNNGKYFLANISPTSDRPLCQSGVPVDFTAHPENLKLDLTNNTLDYDIKISWKRCPNSVNTRAYAIYGDSSICPLSGIYGVNIWAYDCVKYVGNPPYQGPGNGLSCWAGFDSTCVVPNYAGLRYQDQPNYTEEFPPYIVHKQANYGASLTAASGFGAWTIADRQNMCEYYKTGDFNNPQHNVDVRCIAITVGITWIPSLLSNSDSNGTCPLTGWAFDGDYPAKSLYLDLWIQQPDNSWKAEPNGNRHLYIADLPSPTVNGFYQISGNHGYSIPVPNEYYDGKPHNYVIWAYGVDANGKEDDNNMPIRGTPGSFTCPNQQVCSNVSTDVGGEVQPNEPFKIGVDAKAMGSAPPGGIPFTINLDIPGFYNGTLGGTIQAGTNSLTVYTNQLTRSTLGTYQGAYTLNFPSLPAKQCGPIQITVAAKPFFKATAGDIMSGFTNGSSSCSASTAPTSGWPTSPSKGKLIGWYDDGTKQGSGTTMATIALNTIIGVASGQPPSSPPTPYHFSFANETHTADQIGGQYGGTLNCPKNYFSYHPNTAAVSGSGSVSATDVYATGNYTLNNGSLSAAPVGSTGPRAVLYVNGNVYINGDIKLQNGSATSPSQLANYYVVAKGNIYIAPSVKQLDGVYIAQGTSTAAGGNMGQIYTCSNGFNPPNVAMLNNAGSGGCRQNQLTVNGAFIADKVNLYRSYGTLNQNQPAEIFNYTPTVWLATPTSLAPAFGGTTTSGSSSYDAITTLQPVL